MTTIHRNVIVNVYSLSGSTKVIASVTDPGSNITDANVIRECCEVVKMVELCLLSQQHLLSLRTSSTALGLTITAITVGNGRQLWRRSLV